MAVIPRYISESGVTPAINTVKMDPSTAAAPHVAAANSVAQLTDIFQAEMGAWGKAFAAREQEQQRQLEKQRKIQDGLYKAETMANLRIGAEQMYSKGLEESQGNPEFPSLFDNQFKQMADQAILNAPSQEAQVALTKQLIGMRAQYNIRASKDATQLGNQVNMNKLEGVLDNFLGMAAANPESIDTIKKESLDIASSMRALGLPEQAVIKVFEKFDDRLERQAVRSRIQKDPIAVKEEIQQGKFAHLGGGTTEELLNLIKSTESAYKNKISSQLEDMEKRLLAGQPITNNVEEVKAFAEKYGLGDRVEEINRMLEVDKFAADADIISLQTAARELKLAASSGKLDANPQQVKKLESLINGNLKAMEKDPLGYAEIRGSLDPLPVITDFTKVTPQEAEERGFRALQASERYKVPAKALRQVDIDNAASQLKGADPDTRISILKNLGMFGSASTGAVAKELDKEEPALAAALRLSHLNPNLVSKLVRGQELLKGKQVSRMGARERQEEADLALDGLMFEDPIRRNQLVQAAEAVAAYNQEAGTPTSLKETLTGMLNIEEIGNWNPFRSTYKLVMPKVGLSSSEFLETVDNTLTNPEMWSKFATGVPIATDTGEPLQFNNVNPSELQYIFDGNDKYHVTYEGNPLVDATGKAIKIDLIGLFK